MSRRSNVWSLTLPDVTEPLWSFDVATAFLCSFGVVTAPSFSSRVPTLPACSANAA